MGEWNDHEKNLLQALKDDESPSAADASRVKERVLLGVAGAAAAGAATAAVVEVAKASTGAGIQAASSAASGSAASGSAAAGTGLWKALLVVAATAGVGGGVYSVVGGSNSERPIDGPVEHPVAQVESHNVAEALPPKTAEIPAAKQEEPEPPSTPERQVEPKKPSGGGSVKTDLTAEAALLSRAQGALQQGRVQDALAALGEHKKLFPKGVLSGERNAAFAVAYCKAGDLTRGRAGAQSFIRANPKSPMVQRLQAACQLPDASTAQQ